MTRINNIKNPFIVGGYLSEHYFCDREQETQEVIAAIENRRNLVIVSPRRMGKTGLIEHCFHTQNLQKQNFTFFVDLYSTGTLKEFVFLLSKQIFNTLKPSGVKAIYHLFSIIASLRPAFKYDTVTGQPTFDIGLGEIQQPEQSLEEIFNYIDQAKRHCIIVIDEFQQIEKYPEKNTEALLRTHIQRCKNATFIFSGSQRHMMQNIFFSPARPFYQSASLLNLESISLEAYTNFILKHFTEQGKSISAQIIERIYLLLEGHTWYMQMLLNRLFEQSSAELEVTLTDVERVVKQILDTNRVVYQSMLSMLSERQKEVVIAIAKEGKATEVTSSAFAQKHALQSASSTQSAIRQLLEREIVTRQADTYQVYDRFFALWITEVYGKGIYL